MNNTDESLRQTQMTIKVTGMKHCTGCHMQRYVEGGGYIKMIKGGKRWVCQGCIKNYKGTNREVRTK